jgi:hypothetical protein
LARECGRVCDELRIYYTFGRLGKLERDLWVAQQLNDNMSMQRREVLKWASPD